MRSWCFHKVRAISLCRMMLFLIVTGVLICSHSTHSCNEEIYVSDQIQITSPKYGENQTYPLEVTCQWTITAPPGQGLRVEFLDFDVEFHPICKWDYLALSSGACPTSFKTRYCGGVQRVPPQIQFEANNLCIEFVSDKVNPKRGFRILISTGAPDTATTSDLESQKIHNYTSEPTKASGNPSYSSNEHSTTSTASASSSFNESSLSPFISSASSPLTSLAKPSLSSTIKTILLSSSLTSPSPSPSSSSSSSSPSSSSLSKVQSPSGTSVTMSPSLPEEFIPNTTTISIHSSVLLPSLSTEAPTVVPESSATMCPGSKTVWISSWIVVKTYVLDDGRYPPNMDCEIVFRTSDRNVLKLEFMSFDVESHPQCLYDRLYVIDGNETTKPDNVTLCGSSMPDVFISSASSLVLKFMTDHVVQKTGFKANISTISKPATDEPSGVISDKAVTMSICQSEGHITIQDDVFVHSPNFGSGNSYPLSTSCALSLATNVETRLRVEFLGFELENSNNCIWDSVSVYGGSDKQSPLLAKYCGYELPEPVETTGPYMLLEFISDKYIGKKGFRCKISLIASNKSISGGVGLFNVINSSLSYSAETFTTRSSIKNASGDVSTITSSSQSSYPSQQSVSSILSTAAATDGFILPLVKTTESSSIAPNSLKTSQNVTSMLTKSPSKVSSSLTLSFTESDSGRSSKETAPPRVDICANTDIYVDKSVYLLSPGRESNLSYPLGIECTLHVTCETNKVLRLVFQDFEVEYHSKCQWDFLEILEPDRNDPTKSRKLGRFCGLVTPSPIQSSSHQLVLVFHSDHIIPKKGFTLYLKTVEHEQRLYPQPETTSNLPNTTSEYTINTAAYITSTYHELVSQELTSESFSKTSYLNDEPELQTFSGISVGELLSSSTTSLYKKAGGLNSADSPLQSSNSYTEQITTTSQPKVFDICEILNLEVEEEVILISPGIDQNLNYPPNIHCVVEITCKENERLRLEFMEFDIESHSGCMWDFLEILEDKNKVTVGRFCGTTLPDAILSSSNYLRLVFHSDHIVHKKGFNARINTEVVHPLPQDSTPSDSVFNDSLEIEQNITTFVTSKAEHDEDNGIDVLADGEASHTQSNIKVGHKQTAAQSNTPSEVEKSTSSFEKLMTQSGSNTVPEQVYVLNDILTTVKGPAEQADNFIISQEAIPKNDSMNDNGESNGKSDILEKAGEHEPHNGTLAIVDKPVTVSDSSAESPGVQYDFFSQTKKPELMNDRLISDEIEEDNITNGRILPTFFAPSKPSPAVSKSSIVVLNDHTKNFKETQNILITEQITTPMTLTLTSAVASTQMSYASSDYASSPGGANSGSISPSSRKGVFETVTQTSLKSPKISELYSSQIPLSSSLPHQNDLPENCKGEKSLTLMAKSGYITSPGFDNNRPYPPNISCSWEIEDYEKELVMIMFQSFNVEKSENCRWDKVSIYEEGPTESTNLGVFCGDSLPPTITSSQKLHIQFTSDTIVENQGFKLLYKKTPGPKVSLSKKTTCPAGKTPCMISGSCIPLEWLCDGEADCDSGEDETGCQGCSATYFQCGNGKCIPLSQTCSGVAECQHYTDETGCVKAEKEGGISIMKNGRDYRLCYTDDLTSENFDAVCNSAGYRYGASNGTRTTVENDTVSLSNLTSGDTLPFEVGPCESNKIVSVTCHDEDCGKRNITPIHKRIIGGSLSSFGEWPWVVAVRIGEKVACGGSIISDQWVVTAGHCVDSMFHNPLAVSIIAGVNDINDPEREVQVVVDIQLHHDYSFIYNADVALLRLQRPLHLGPNIRTICLPWDKREFPPSSSCYIAGWGVSNMTDYFTTIAPQFLRHTKTKIVSPSTCRSAYSYKMEITDSMMCAGYIGGGIDACKGDSGGPLMCETNPGRWALAGVISWGEMCASFNKPGVYTKIMPFLPWIDLVLGREDTFNVSCTFESSNWCGYDDKSGQGYLWSRRPGGKSYSGKPTKDHTFGNKTGHYMFAARVDQQGTLPATAVLLSPVIESKGFKCVNFAFIFSGSSRIKLSLYGIRSDKEEQLWQISQSTASGSWKETEVALPSDVSRLKLMSIHYNGNDGVGIDDISMTMDCSGLHFVWCNFNEGTFCGYNNYVQNYNSFAINTDPNDNSNMYAALNPNKVGYGFQTTSMLLSPSLPERFIAIPHCLTFKLKVKTDASILMIVTLKDIRSNFLNKNVLWTSTNITVTGGWTKVRVDILDGYYNRLGFEGQVDHGRFGDNSIAIDDIEVFDGNCL